MANKFVTWLQNVPGALKKFFTNPVVDTVVMGGLGIAGMIDPALLPFLGGIGAAVAKAESLAAAANLQSGSGSQKLALALADAQATFQAYQDKTGAQIETTQQTDIINAFVALLNKIPAPAQVQTLNAPTKPTVPSVL